MSERKKQLRLAQKRYRRKVSESKEVTRINMVVSTASYNVLAQNAEIMSMSIKDCFAFIMNDFEREHNEHNEHNEQNDIESIESKESHGLKELSRDELVIIVKKQEFWLQRYKEIIDALQQEK